MGEHTVTVRVVKNGYILSPKNGDHLLTDTIVVEGLNNLDGLAAALSNLMLDSGNDSGKEGE